MNVDEIVPHDITHRSGLFRLGNFCWGKPAHAHNIAFFGFGHVTNTDQRNIGTPRLVQRMANGIVLDEFKANEGIIHQRWRVQRFALATETGHQSPCDVVGIHRLTTSISAADGADKGALPSCSRHGVLGNSADIASHTDSDHRTIGQDSFKMTGDQSGEQSALLILILVVNRDQGALDAEALNQRLFQVGGQGIAGPYTNLDNALLQGASKHPANRCS